MEQQGTTIAVQRFLDELAAVGTGSPAEPVIRALLERSACRLEALCGSLLYRSYSRLARGPTNLHADELLGGVVERLLKAMREVRPETVRQFFALANCHIRWELNDLARRVDRQEHLVSIEGLAAAPAAPAAPQTGSSSPGPCANMQRILQAIDALPEEEREVLCLVRLQSMTKAEAAAVLGVTEKTVQRRIRRSILLLSEGLGELAPATAPGAHSEEAETDGR